MPLSEEWLDSDFSRRMRESSITCSDSLYQMMERRLQTVVAKRKLANSVHHARVLIRQRHISVGKQLVNIPSYLVRVSSEQHIQLAPGSVFKTGKNGRTKRKKAAAAKGGEQ